MGTSYSLVKDSLQAYQPVSSWTLRIRRKGLQRLFHFFSQINFYYFWDRRWFIIAILVGSILLNITPPEGLSRDGMIVLTMSIVATILFITEPIPLPTVSLMIILGQVILLDIDSTTVAKSLMTDSVLFIMGSLMLAVAVVKQKLDKRIAWVIVKVTGTNTMSVALGIALFSGILASFIGEHTVAAMMLPVGMTLLTLTSDNPKKIHNLAAILLFSICYGSSIASIGTPSGGARNAIMVNYWHNSSIDIDYVTWMIYSYPMYFIQLPIFMLVMAKTYKPEYSDLSRAVAKLRMQVAMEGALKPSSWVAIILFISVLIGWITLSNSLGMGTIAILGAAAFLIAGLVKWEDINSGVNWGVVLLYAAVISLGVQMKDTGAAQWLAQQFLHLLEAVPILDLHHGKGLNVSISMLTAIVTNTMSNGAAVAVLGPIVLNIAETANESPIILGFVAALSSSFAYLTVVGTPACTIVYSAGYLKPIDFLKLGGKLTVTSIIVMFFISSFYWPLLG